MKLTLNSMMNDYKEKLNDDTYNDKEKKYPNQQYQPQVSQYYQSIPEARDLQWNDNFFDITDNGGNDYDTEQDIVAVFDYNYEQIIDYSLKIGVLYYLIIISAVWLYVYMLNFTQEGYYDEYGEVQTRYFSVPYYVYSILFVFCIVLGYNIINQIKWSIYSKHIAITRDGIRYVSDKHKSCFGIPMCDIGKYSKTIPFDKITDCDIVEPAGAVCCCIQRVLTHVRIDTASSGGGGGSDGRSGSHDLNVTGLVNPHGFKKLVWAMKRRNYSSNNNNQYIDPNLLLLSSSTNGYNNNTANTRNGPVLETINETTTTARTSGGIDSNSSTIQFLLVDIRNELRENNQLLKEMKSKEDKSNTTSVAASAASTGMTSDNIEIV